MIGQRLARDREAAHVGPLLAVGNAIFEETGGAELAHQRAAFIVEAFGVAPGEIVGAPILEVVRHLPVSRREERPGEETLVGHQLPWKTGFCLAEKAS